MSGLFIDYGMMARWVTNCPGHWRNVKCLRVLVGTRIAFPLREKAFGNQAGGDFFRLAIPHVTSNIRYLAGKTVG